MAIVALVVAALAVLVAMLASKRAGALAGRIHELESVARSTAAAADEAKDAAARVTQFLKRMADGRRVNSEMIEDGRLFDEIDSQKAQALLEGPDGPSMVVLDVRTTEEVEGGHIPGMLWIPVDQIEQRYREVPRNKKVLVFCAAGGRSAAACDFLSTRGYEDLVNVSGGMSAWRGKTKKGSP
jgi:rhodanese-related sulfurtransferase